MVFKTERSIAIPNKDILSWTFDDNQFDQDEPRYVDAKNPVRSISLRQARSIIRKLAAGFHAAGLKKGDCVCLHSFNDIYYSMLFLGIIAAGGVFAGSNPAYTEFELVHHIKISKAKFLITEPEMLDNICAAAKGTGIPPQRIWIFDTLGQSIPSGFRSFKDLMEHGEEDWVRFDDEKTSRETTATRLFSSGTTGLPKAVVLSHYNLIAQHTLAFEFRSAPWMPRRLLCTPLFHAAAVPVAHTSILRGGQVAVVMRRFELEPCLAYIENFELNEMVLVPPIVIAIIMSGLGKKVGFQEATTRHLGLSQWFNLLDVYSLKSMKRILIGAAPLGKESQAKLRQMVGPGASVVQVWGMTETSCIGSMFHYPEDDETGSVGRILPNIDAKIVDDDGKEVGYDTRGELCVRGPTVTSGYFENPKANAESFDSEGFFKTGDIVYCDGKTKKWYVVDRKKELIKVRAFQVAPPELESVLLSHPYIVDAAVIGIKDPVDKDIEYPRAYVVKRPAPESKSLDEKAVKEYCGTRLAKYKELTGGVKFMEAIPKNASGKILKRLLREMAEKEAKEGKAKL